MICVDLCLVNVDPGSDGVFDVRRAGVCNVIEL